MSNLHVRYLLVGGGLASSAAAESIRRIDPQGSLMLVGQEINRPYRREALSKGYLRREVSRASLSTHDAEWFTANHVQFRSGRRVAHVDTPRYSVTLDNGEEISYDKLLLATGASPKPLSVSGATLPNVFYLRSLEHVDRLHQAIDKAKREGRVHTRGKGWATVVGGGVLGLEIAASLCQMGMAVDLVVGEAHPWEELVSDVTGKFLVRHLEKNGIRVHLGSRLQKLEGDGRVQRATLMSGAIFNCDFVVAAVGVVPNKELLRSTPIVAENAILVDEHGQTNVSGVYAAGDCAAVFDPLFGKHRLLHRWQTAAASGEMAGMNMTGANATFSEVTRFSSEIFGLQLSVWGEPRQVNHRLLRGTPTIENPNFVEVGVAADGKVAEVLAVGHAGEEAALRELVARRVLINGSQEQLKNPTTKISDLLTR